MDTRPSSSLHEPLSPQPLASIIEQAPQARQKPSRFAWWYRLTAPPEAPLSAPPWQREIARRGRLTSLVLLIAVLLAAGTLPVSLRNALHVSPLLLPIMIGVLVLQLSAFFFNRAGNISIAGIIAVVGTEFGIIMVIVTAPQGLTIYSLTLYDLLVQPELIAVSLLPPYSVFVVALANSLFILGSIYFLPHAPDLSQLIATQGAGPFMRIVTGQIIVAVVTFLWVSGTNRALKRADRAEEIARLQQTIAEQEHLLADQKRLLDASIQQIEQIHEQVANGNLSARVPLVGGNVLWSIAGKLNMLLSRYQRASQAEERLQQTEAALTHLVHALQQSRDSGVPLAVRRTGTAVDPLLLELVTQARVSVTGHGQTPMQSVQPPAKKNPLPRRPTFLPENP